MFGFGAFVAVRAVTGVSVAVSIPLHQSVWTAFCHLRNGARWLFATALAAAVVAAVAGSKPLVFVAGGAVVVAICLVAVADVRLPAVAISSDGATVTVSRCHPDYIAAIAALENPTG